MYSRNIFLIEVFHYFGRITFLTLTDNFTIGCSPIYHCDIQNTSPKNSKRFRTGKVKYMVFNDPCKRMYNVSVKLNIKGEGEYSI